MLAPNSLLQNRYRIVRELGQGGMGTVYEAVDQRLSSVVAIKETFITTTEGCQAFQREASLLANLRHPSLPNVIDHFAEGDGQYLVMEFISGEDLAQLLELRQRAFPTQDVLRWGDALLKALEYLHALSPPVLHRDIKPSNIKLTRAGELFLIDFGLAKGTAGQMPALLTSRSIQGYTPVYAPLEQIHGAGTDPRSDLYSLAATLYHLVTGVAPADAPARFSALDDEQPDPLRPADELNREVPHAVAAVLARAMAMNRKQRPATATEMRQLLRTAGQTLAEAQSATTVRNTPRIIPPTEPAPGSAASLGASPEPTVNEIPRLIQRPQAAPLGAVLFPEPSPESQPASAPRKRSRGAKLGITAIVMFVLLIFGSAILAPALIWRFKRANNANGTTASNPSADNQTVARVDPTPVVPAKPSFSGDFNAGKALELIYGNYDVKKKYAKWKLTAADVKKLGLNSSFSFVGNVYTSALVAQGYVQNGEQKYVVITQTVPPRYDCHACGPIVGGATFSKPGNDWQLDTDTRYVTTMGGFGNAPKGKLTKIGPERYGVVFYDGSTGQGTTEEAMILIADVDGALRELITVSEFSGDNSGADCGGPRDPTNADASSIFGGPCYRYSSKPEFEPGANPEYFDLKVTTIGTKLDNADKPRRVNAVKKYSFNQGKYTLVK
jgi:serine/threonine protein kinase